MLTQIEWWGGLLIIWMVLAYSAIYKDLMHESKLDLTFLLTTLVHVIAIGVLAAYFYSLESDTSQLIYIGAIGAGLLITLYLFFAPGSEDQEEIATGEDEEVGKGYEIAGQMILFLPLLVSLGLGGYKALAVTAFV